MYQPEGVPITIGVIGHRDLLPKEIPRIQAQFRMVIDAYRLRYPQSRILLISALAEGADQIAVEACQGVADLDVLALLPMPIDEYENDFISTSSLEKFRSLLNRANYISDVQRLAPNFFYESRSNTDFNHNVKEARDRAYQQCARFTSINSHVLIAIWDGQPPGLVGGTADTMHSRMKSDLAFALYQTQLDLQSSEPGIQIHIDANRLNVIGADAGGSAYHDLIPVPQLLLTPDTATPWTDSFIDPVSDHINSLNKTLNSSISQISPVLEIEPFTLSESVMQASDLIANQYKKRFRRLSAALLIIGLLTILAIHLVQNSDNSWLFASAITIFLVTGVLWWVLSKAGYKDAFEQFRALAEGARVQQVWLASDIDECPSDTYLVDQDDVNWIRRALRSTWLVDRLNQQLTKPTLQPKAAVQLEASAAEIWIKDQLEYLLGTTPRTGAANRSIRKVRQYRIIAGVGILIAFIGLVPEFMRFTTAIQFYPWLFSLSQGMWEVGLGIFAVSIAYSELMAFREVGRQHLMNVDLFRSASNAINLQSTPSDNQEHLRRLTKHVGTEALRQTSAWMAINHDRSVRPL